MQLCVSLTGKPLTDDELRLIAGYPHQLALLFPGLVGVPGAAGRLVLPEGQIRGAGGRSEEPEGRSEEPEGRSEEPEGRSEDKDGPPG